MHGGRHSHPGSWQLPKKAGPPPTPLLSSSQADCSRWASQKVSQPPLSELVQY